MQKARPRVRDGTASRQRGKARVREILRAARLLFQNEGYAGISLRRVAESAGISLGNLTYYFSSKADLFESMIDDVLTEYAVAGQKSADQHRQNPEDGFEDYLRFLFADCKKQETQKFFYQLWATASHDKFASMARKRVYLGFRDALFQVGRIVNSNLNDEQLLQRVVLLMALVEGLHVILGNGEQTKKFVNNLEPEFLRQAIGIIKS